MNDRELLECAAKAIGTVFVPGESWDDGAGWNPLTSDGDALRLAVKLDINHFRRETYICAQVYERDDIIANVYKVAEDVGDDPMAATRRAIVRAAAELGRARA